MAHFVNIPKRQHYVAEMILKRFTNAQGRLHFFDKRFPENGVLTSTPKNLFLENHIYTQYDKQGVKDVSLEIFFSKLESEANQIIEKIVAAARIGHTPNLNALRI